TAAAVRAAFSHSGGNLGTSGSVAFQFERKGQIMLEKEVCPDEDEFMMAVAEAGGADYEDALDEWIVYTAPTDLMAVKRALDAAGIATKGAEMIMVPTTLAQVSVSDAKKVMRLVDKLDELEDLQNVYHAMELTEEIVAALDE
ncbi:MAG: YebC/PmpR family DNA-binding transcriptional regulator, partial [Raoultibacter sp.]